jgi:hypothetical protein
MQFGFGSETLVDATNRVSNVARNLERINVSYVGLSGAESLGHWKTRVCRSLLKKRCILSNLSSNMNDFEWHLADTRGKSVVSKSATPKIE